MPVNQNTNPVFMAWVPESLRIVLPGFSLKIRASVKSFLYYLLNGNKNTLYIFYVEECNQILLQYVKYVIKVLAFR